MDGSGDYRSPVAAEPGYVDDARSTIAQADSVLHVVGLSGPMIERLVLEETTGGVQRLLRDTSTAADGLRRLADEIDVAANAIRSEAATAWDRHDKQRAVERDMERPQRVPASRTGGDSPEAGPGRAY